MFRLFVIILCLAVPGGLAAMQTSQGSLKVTEMAGGLEEPWSVAFLPNGNFLVTERGGSLWRFNGKGGRVKIRGVPKVFAREQGGLLDVMVPRDFSTSREVYLSFAARIGSGTGTALGRGKLDKSGRRLIDFETIFRMSPSSRSGIHFGGRIVEASDGTIFLTVGERGDRPWAQDLRRHNGSVLRLTRDGKPAPGNPFLKKRGAKPEIWSYGHRNPQGATLDLKGRLVIHEHGARGGDEINRIKKGANYGWPVIAYGRHYNGNKIGEGTRKAGMEQPNFYWDPSIAPSGMAIYSGKLFPDWRGDIFVGSLISSSIIRLEERNGRIKEVERLKSPQTGRVRDVRQAPDGSIWFIGVHRGGVFRISR